MATIAFKPYTYKPTAPRSKSTATHRRPAPEQVSNLNKLQHITSSGASLSTPRLAADNPGYWPGIRGTGTVFGGTDNANNDETDDDDRDLPTIEELLFTNLQAQGFTTSRSAQSDNSGGSPDPSVLLGDGNLSAPEADANDVNLRAESATAPGAGLFDSPETAIDSTTEAPPRSSDGWHDIDDFLEPAPRSQLVEYGASTPNSLHPCTPSSHLSSEPLYNSISTKGRTRSEAIATSSSPLPRHARASPETQLSQEGYFYTGRGVADKHELVDHTLDTLLIDEGARKQQEQEKNEGNGEDEDDWPQQEINVMAPVVTAERAGGSPGPANRCQQSLPNLDPSPEPSYNKVGSRSGSDSDDELNSTGRAEDNKKKPPPAKQKQLSSQNSLTRKKRKRSVQESSFRQHKDLSDPHCQYLKSHSSLDQYSRIATSSSAKGRLPSPVPSPVPSILQSIDTKMSHSDSNLSPSRATLPTLTEITFRPHSAHYYSFTATIWGGYDGQGVSLAQLARLIANTGHVGKIDDFTIKPIEQYSYLLSGFSQHTSSFITGEAGRDYVDVTRTRPQDSRFVDARAFASRRSKPSSSDNDESGSSDSDLELGSNGDGDGYSSEDELGRSGMRINVPWGALDEQRLLAWKKEGKSWKWIFKKFPGRTPAAVRTRWTMVQHRVK